MARDYPKPTDLKEDSKLALHVLMICVPLESFLKVLLLNEGSVKHLLFEYLVECLAECLAETKERLTTLLSLNAHKFMFNISQVR